MLGQELMWSQAALMRVSWQVLVQEQEAASDGASPSALSTPARSLQRLLWCHAHHTLPFPQQASHMVADALVPRLHNLTCDEARPSVFVNLLQNSASMQVLYCCMTCQGSCTSRAVTLSVARF